MMKTINIIKKVRAEARQLQADANMAAFAKHWQDEYELTRQSLILTKRYSSYEVLVSKLSLHEKINVRPMTYLERIQAHYNLAV